MLAQFKAKEDSMPSKGRNFDTSKDFKGLTTMDRRAEDEAMVATAESSRGKKTFPNF